MGLANRGRELRRENRVNWSSWGDFLAMGGYAFYVWGSYMVTVAMIAIEVLMLARRKRGALARIGRAGAANRSSP
jgi:heme exporter protein D